ncbi:11544_t:CDS:2, partial [Acaulospora colombiana]
RVVHASLKGLASRSVSANQPRTPLPHRASKKIGYSRNNAKAMPRWYEFNQMKKAGTPWTLPFQDLTKKSV